MRFPFVVCCLLAFSGTKGANSTAVPPRTLTAFRMLAHTSGGVQLTQLTWNRGQRVGFLHFVSEDLASEPVSD